MAALIPWMRGRHVWVTVTPMTVTSTGSLVPGSTTSFAGICERVEGRLTPRKEEVSALDSARENDVIIKERAEVTLTEIARVSGSTLHVLFSQYDYFGVVISGYNLIGGITWVFSFVGNRGDLDFTFEAGKSLVSAVFTNVDSGANNPTYAF